MRIDELRDVLRQQADELGGAEPLAPQVRADRTVRRAESSGARRRGSFGAALAGAAVAAVTAIVVVPPLLPEPPAPSPAPFDPMVRIPPRLAGHVIPLKVTVRMTSYQYVRSQQVDQSRERLLVAVAPAESPQVLGWSTSPGTPGRVVVSVDGAVVRRGSTGGFAYGVPLAPNATHLVVVRVTRPVPGKQIGVAVYGPERF